MKTINSFSCNRLWAVTKRDFVMDWKANLAFFIEITGVFLVGLIVIILSNYVSSFHHVRFIPTADTFYSWFSFIAFVGILLQASRLFQPLARKSGSIGMLMLPASNAEKFVSRVLLATVGYGIMVLAALEVVSLLYYPLAWLFDAECGSLSLYSIKTLFSSKVYAHVEVNNSEQMFRGTGFFAAAWWLWVHSAFSLSSALWRRFPFVKMLFTGLAVTFVLGIVFAWIWHPTTQEYVVETMTTVFVVVGSLMLLFTVANWAAAYWLFTRKQIVDIKRR